MHTVIFDVGGTLIDSPDLFKHIMASFYEEDVEVERYLLHKFSEYYQGNGPFFKIATILEKVFSEIAMEFNIKDYSSLTANIYKEFFTQKTYLYEDTISVLKFMKNKNTRLLICSDADSEVLREELIQFKIKDYFERIFISSDIKAYKPSEKVVSILSDIIMGNREEILFVGDSRQDIITGQKLGIKTAYINRLNKKIDVKADYEIKQLAELCALYK